MLYWVVKMIKLFNRLNRVEKESIFSIYKFEYLTVFNNLRLIYFCFKPSSNEKIFGEHKIEIN